MEWFLLNCTGFMLTNLMSSPLLSCIVSCSMSFTTLVLLLPQTFWKWPILLHSMHIFPYSGCYLGGCVLHSICMSVSMVCWILLALFVFFACMLSYLNFVKLLSLLCSSLLLLELFIPLPSSPMTKYFHW